jgi:chloramphenicol 3-O phosphotransferase
MSTERPIVLVLTGPSSAGKTSLAKEIQRRSEVPFVHLEADRLFPSMPEDVRRTIVLDHGSEAIVLLLHRSMAAWARRGLNIIVDGSLPYGNPELRSRCLSIFADFDLRLVTVRCDSAVLTRRGHGRADRPSGWAVKQAVDIHHELVGDARADTSEMPPSRCAASVLEQLHLADRTPTTGT